MIITRRPRAPAAWRRTLPALDDIPRSSRGAALAFAASSTDTACREKRCNNSFVRARAFGPPSANECAHPRAVSINRAGRRHGVDEPRPHRLLGADQLAGQQQVAGRAFADVAQQVRQDHRRHQTATHLRVAEPRLRNGNGQIADGNQPRPAGHRGPVDGGDGRLRAGVNAVVQVRQAQARRPRRGFLPLAESAIPVTPRGPCRRRRTTRRR